MEDSGAESVRDLRAELGGHSGRADVERMRAILNDGASTSVNTGRAGVAIVVAFIAMTIDYDRPAGRHQKQYCREYANPARSH